jgi:hypothetical protein
VEPFEDVGGGDAEEGEPVGDFVGSGVFVVDPDDVSPGTDFLGYGDEGYPRFSFA